jgi:MoaA/NifB/PqqE/SkfB family radical SAM enzyme
MLTQIRAQELMALQKYCVDSSPIPFPPAGTATRIELKSNDHRVDFLVDVNRKGRIRLSKCTFQERYAVVEILLRLDVDGPPHENPDGDLIPCPHLHIYREGFGTKWAIALPQDFTNTTDLPKTLREFLEYCNVQKVPSVQRSLM